MAGATDSISATVSALFKRLKIPRPKGGGLHLLRHTHTSVLLAEGVPVAAVSARLTRISHRPGTATDRRAGFIGRPAVVEKQLYTFGTCILQMTALVGGAALWRCEILVSAPSRRRSALSPGDLNLMCWLNAAQLRAAACNRACT